MGVSDDDTILSKKTEQEQTKFDDMERGFVEDWQIINRRWQKMPKNTAIKASLAFSTYQIRPKKLGVGYLFHFIFL